LGFLGIELEEKRNIANAQVVSTENGKTLVCVIHTDEELMIAETASQIINLNIEKGY
jgi:acetate kinase